MMQLLVQLILLIKIPRERVGAGFRGMASHDGQNERKEGKGIVVMKDNSIFRHNRLPILR